MTRTLLLLLVLMGALGTAVAASEPVIHLDAQAGLGIIKHYYRFQEIRERITDGDTGPALGLTLWRDLGDRAQLGLSAQSWIQTSDPADGHASFNDMQFQLRGRWRPGGGPVWVGIGGGLGRSHLERDTADGQHQQHDGVGWVGSLSIGTRIAHLAGRPLGLGYEVLAMEIEGDGAVDSGDTKGYLHTVTLTYRIFSL